MKTKGAFRQQAFRIQTSLRNLSSPENGILWIQSESYINAYSDNQAAGTAQHLSTD